MKFPQSRSRSVGAAWRIVLFLAALLPVRAFAHEGENKGPWIDFSQYGFDGITQMMNAHPAFVHFPIALLPAILVFYCLGTWFKWPSLLIAGRATLYLAFLSLIIVVYTGLSARSAPSNDASEATRKTHKTTGFVTTGRALCCRRAKHRRWRTDWGGGRNLGGERAPNRDDAAAGPLSGRRPGR